MELRKRVVGDLYLASSVPFIFVAFLYFLFRGNGWVFLAVGLAIAMFGMETKRIMTKREGKGQVHPAPKKTAVSIKPKKAIPKNI